MQPLFLVTPQKIQKKLEQGKKFADEVLNLLILILLAIVL